MEGRNGCTPGVGEGGTQRLRVQEGTPVTTATAPLPRLTQVFLLHLPTVGLHTRTTSRRQHRSVRGDGERQVVGPTAASPCPGGDPGTHTREGPPSCLPWLGPQSAVSEGGKRPALGRCLPTGCSTFMPGTSHRLYQIWENRVWACVPVLRPPAPARLSGSCSHMPPPTRQTTLHAQVLPALLHGHLPT